MKKRPKRPESIKVGPFSYAVVGDVALQRSNLLGECNPSDLMILFDPNQNPAVCQETIVHEALHALMYASGLAAQMSNDHHEVVVATLAPWLLMWLRDNPEVVAWLTTS